MHFASADHDKVRTTVRSELTPSERIGLESLVERLEVLPKAQKMARQVVRLRSLVAARSLEALLGAPSVE